MHVIVAICGSFVICLAIFFGMHLMTSSANANIDRNTQIPQLVYLRDKHDTDIKTKKRITPKEEVKKVVQKIKIAQPKLEMNIQQNVKLKPLQMEPVPINISAISSLSGAQVGFSQKFLDANMLQTLRKTNPKYPRRAKLKKQEGFVQLAFTIEPNGFVSAVKVLASNPPNVFEKNAIKAIKRWRFKETKSTREASITFNFRLAR